MINKILLFLGLALPAFILLLLVNTFRFESRQVAVAAVEPVPVPDSAVAHLSAAVRIPTVSPGNPAAFDPAPFAALRDFLSATYPLTHTHLQREVVLGHSLLYYWPGRNPALKPAVLLAHQDVVPVEEESLAKWTVPPFSGAVQDGYIWGRGTMDDKIGVIAILEAVERSLLEGFVPERSVYLAFGHDEEVGGKGAAATAALLQSRQVEAEFVLDEGQVVTTGLVPGMEAPVALIGTAEKGFLTLELLVEEEGGHSSMPPKETAVSRLSRAIVRLSENPLPKRLSPPVEGFIRYLGPEMPFLERVVFANAWLFKPIILRLYEQSPSGNALVRTTTAPTILRSGVKDNVLPTEARGAVNFRILPGSSIQEVMGHAQEVIDDERVRLSPKKSFLREPSPVSPTDVPAFSHLARSIREVYPGTVVAPTLVLAGTDSYHYTGVSPNIYRFAPLILGPEDLSRIHGTDERIRVEDFRKSIHFYYRLLRNLQE
ncbi:M20 family peptidase [soil metagenome]